MTEATESRSDHAVRKRSIADRRSYDRSASPDSMLPLSNPDLIGIVKAVSGLLATWWRSIRGFAHPSDRQLIVAAHDDSADLDAGPIIADLQATVLARAVKLHCKKAENSSMAIAG